MRACSKCGQLGHNVKTCGKVKVVKEPSFQRKCTKCQGFGHNSRTCLGKEANERKTLLDKGLEILAQQNKKAERIEVDGVTPHRGLWLVNEKKKRCAGLISIIKKSGNIVWKDFDGVLVNSTQERIISAGYKYLFDKPEGEDWTYLHLGVWESNPNTRQIIPESEQLNAIGEE